MQEFSTLKRRLGLEDSEEELAFEVDFTKNLTLYSLAMYGAYSSYIKKKLAMGISNGLSLSPTTARLIKKREKASKTLKLSGQLAIKELFKKKQAELDRTRLTSERQVQQFDTILVGNARLKTIARNLAKEAAIDAIEACKAKRLRKRREKEEGLASRKAEREAKRAEKKA